MARQRDILTRLEQPTSRCMRSPTAARILRVLSIRDFRLLWLGSAISCLGSQFSVIALPWLILQLTGDPLALGAVLALAGIPRAVFILLGGTISDRFSPRNVLLVCDWINFVMTAVIAALVFTGTMQIWMVYVFSLLSGVVAGFVIPASNSIVPALVPEEDLQAGNSISMGSVQLVGFVGPALAGILIGAYSQSTLGVSIAFSLDSMTFAVSALALAWMRTGRRRPGGAGGEAAEPVWSSIRTAARHLWGHAELRFMFVTMVVMHFLYTGPLFVGIPVLADRRLPEGARAFGFLMAAFAGGNLGGYILAGMQPKMSGRSLSVSIVALLATFGGVMVGLGWIGLTWVDVALMTLLGVGNGYLGLVILTWIQQRTPREMLGRIMSMVLLAITGLTPLSQSLSGAIIRWSLTGLFALAGTLLLSTAVWAALQPALAALGREMAGEPRIDLPPADPAQGAGGAP